MKGGGNMDDIISQLSSFLSSPDGQNKLKDVASMLSGNNSAQGPDLSALSGLFSGLNNNNTNASNTSSNNNANAFQNNNANQNNSSNNSNNGSGFDLSALSGLLANLQNNSNQNGGNNSSQSPDDFLKTLDISKLMQIQQAFAVATQDDEKTTLLRALKPLLSEPRQVKVDKALRIMKLIHLVPLIKESGLFGGDLF